MAPSLDEFDVIIRSCIVFSQSTVRYTELKIKLIKIILLGIFVLILTTYIPLLTYSL